MGRRPYTEVQRIQAFWTKVIKTTNCWTWTAAQNGTGYGVFKYAGRMQLAHRVSLQLTQIKLEDDKVVDHVCRNRLCVRPDHLEQVTMSENILRGEKGRLKVRDDKCPSGHEYTEENTYIRTDGGGRACRECTNARQREAYSRKLGREPRNYRKK